MLLCHVMSSVHKMVNNLVAMCSQAFAQDVVTESDVCCTEFLGGQLLLQCAQQRTSHPRTTQLGMAFQKVGKQDRDDSYKVKGKCTPLHLFGIQFLQCEKKRFSFIQPHFCIVFLYFLASHQLGSLHFQFLLQPIDLLSGKQ